MKNQRKQRRRLRERRSSGLKERKSISRAWIVLYRSEGRETRREDAKIRVADMEALRGKQVGAETGATASLAETGSGEMEVVAEVGVEEAGGSSMIQSRKQRLRREQRNSRRQLRSRWI